MYCFSKKYKLKNKTSQILSYSKLHTFSTFIADKKIDAFALSHQAT